MKSNVQSPVFGYGLAIASTALATGLHVLAQPWLGSNLPYITFFPAVFLTAWFARLGPTLLAVGLSGLAATYWFVPPVDSLIPAEGPALAGLILFTIFGVAIALLAEQTRRSSAQAEREHERFAVTLASIGDGVIVTDQKAEVTFLNSVAEQLTGWALTEARGKPLQTVFRIMGEESRQPAECPVDKALREGHVVGLANHTILIAKDGSERAIDDSAAPIRDRDQEILGVVLVFRDVSHQRASQIVRGRLAALVDSSEDAILGQTFEGVITDWNAGAERLFGFSAEETVGKPIFSTIAPPDRKDELLAVLDRVRRGDRLEQFETVRQCKDGRCIPVAVRISPIHGAEGEVVGASAIDRDISRQRAAEQRRAARLAVTQILAHEQSIEKAIAEILAAVGEALQWDAGGFWRLHGDENVLRCSQFWSQPSRDVDEFRAATVRLTFGPGNSLPGRVWETGQPVWIADVVQDLQFIRASRAGDVGLHGGFACPVAVGDHFLGAIEWFSREIQQPDEDLLEMMATLGGQIGQFIERRQAEQELRRSEQELSDFFENAAVGLHWVGPDGIILRVNQAELDMLGYTHDEYVGRHIAEFHADPPVIEDILRCLTAGEQLHDYEARLHCKDGSIKHVLIDSNVLWEDGEFVHTRCFTRDISERKRAETLLRESNERLAVALDAGGMGTWEWNIPTGEVVWSPALEAIHGLARGSFPGTFEAYQQDIHPEDHEHVVESIRRTLREGRDHRLEYRIVWPDGSVRWLEARGKLFRDDAGDPVRLVGVCSDVTERKRLERSLRFVAEASKSLSALVDYRSTLQKVAHLAVPDYADWCAVDMLDDDGALQRLAVAHVDPSKVELAEEFYRRYPPPPDSPHGVRKVLRTGEPDMMPEISDALLKEAAQDDEHLRMLRELELKSYMCVPLKGKNATFGVITFVSSDPGRPYSTDDLSMAEDLAHRAAIAIENAQLYAQVREADRRKDEFLAMLAHELRNPLAPIRSGLDVLAMDTDGQQETITLMQEQVEHVVRLVDDLLDVSRIMRGKVELRREPVELSMLLKRSVKAVQPLIDSHRQELIVCLPQHPIWLDADPVRLVQIIENLLNNASKYTDAGGRIELSAEPHDGEAVIGVRDTGIGIEPELLPDVFKLFTQSSRTLDRAQGGLGIGLTLVQRLVDMHGGAVTVDSDGPGRGSTFTVRLPVTDAAAPARQEVPEHRSVQGRRVLVVDDNVGAARLLTVLLTRLDDHRVETAHDGSSALAKIRESHPEIVLLDIGLPGMDGYQVAREVRQDPQFDDVLLIALTGYGQEEDRQKSKEAGFDEHLVKPPSVEQIKQVLSHPKMTR